MRLFGDDHFAYVDVYSSSGVKTAIKLVALIILQHHLIINPSCKTSFAAKIAYLSKRSMPQETTTCQAISISSNVRCRDCCLQHCLVNYENWTSVVIYTSKCIFYKNNLIHYCNLSWCRTVWYKLSDFAIYCAIGHLARRCCHL